MESLDIPEITVDLAGWMQVLLGVLAIAITYLLFRRGQRRKELSFAIITNRPLITSKSHAFPLDVTYDGRAIKDPHIIVWRLVNSGGQPIRASDVESHIALKVSGADIVSSDVTFTRPPSFRPEIVSVPSDTVFITPCLMNERDLVEIQMLVDGELSSADVEGRIVGIPGFTRATRALDARKCLACLGFWTCQEEWGGQIR